MGDAGGTGLSQLRDSVRRSLDNAPRREPPSGGATPLDHRVGDPTPSPGALRGPGNNLTTLALERGLAGTTMNQFRLTTFVFTLALGLLAAAPAEAARPAPKALMVPVFAYITPDGSLGEPCEESCLKKVAAKVRTRRGVKKATVEGKEILLQIIPGVFKSESVIRDLVGLKVEMRLPFAATEIRFVPSAPFPPAAFLQEGTLVIEFGADVQKEIDAVVGFKLPNRMKCTGKTDSEQAKEATLERYEKEKRPPFSMVPFLAEADLDGDKRQDLYLRIVGLPELVIFNRAAGPKAVTLSPAGSVDEIPRCDQNPLRYARGVARAKTKCIDGGRPQGAKGDAIERIEHNRTSDLLVFTDSGFTTCEPFGEGALPPLPPADDEDE